MGALAVAALAVQGHARKLEVRSKYLPESLLQARKNPTTALRALIVR